jgi:uncharacterized protein (TIGR02117 family)
MNKLTYRKRWGKRILTFIAIILAFIGAYLLLTGIGTLIPVNQSFTQPEEGVTIYVTTNGFHTDIVLPVRGRRDKCFQVLETPRLAEPFASAQYIAYGWGDLNFYMESYSDGFPSIGTILGSFFVPGKSLMHVKFYAYGLQPNEWVRAIEVSEEQYEQLVDFVHASFRTEAGSYVFLDQAGYGTNDFFFEARGKYYGLNTCNNWTGRGLKTTGIPTSLWTPLAQSVFVYLPD